jgi:membrane-associated phospholipid phosphatase
MKFAAGIACLAAVVAIGLAVGHGPTPARLDDGVRRHLGAWLDHRSYRGLVKAVGAERSSGHGAYVTAAVPLVAAGAVALATRGRRLLAWLPWLVVILLTVPLAWVLRVGFARPGPDEGPVHAWSQGAYPSGGALLVALGWTIGVAVIASLRPTWRPPMVAIAALALPVHLFARVAVGDHWLTDVLGAYLLVAGVALLADRLRPGRG